MLDRLWDFFVDSLVVLFIPLVLSYYAISTNVFINISVQDAKDLEWLGNSLLTPVHYLLAGETAIRKENGSFQFEQTFDYQHAFWLKTTSSLLALPPSLILGSTIKGLSFFSKTTRKNHFLIHLAKASTETLSNKELYREMGLIIGEAKETLIPQNYARKKGDEKNLMIDKLALKDIAEVLNQAKITWWLDCGSCLGTYRYGGVIPWDEDIDIAILQPDSENVRKALNRLDRNKYLVQNWSSRELPYSCYKIYIRKSRTMIDIYHFKILTNTKQIAFIFSLENHIFFPKWWKIREKRFKVPISFDLVFPLKKALFDGIEVFVPNNTKKYLQRYYGENLDPVKIYNQKTNRYEKDLTHPYWQRAYVH